MLSNLSLKALFFSIFLVGCGESCGSNSKDSSPSEPESLVTWDDCGYTQEEHMCNLQLTDQHGEDFELYDHIGKPIVLDFSTMWCGYCRVTAGSIQSISDQYAEEDLEFITILIDDLSGQPVDLADLQLWSDTYGLDDHFVLGGDREMLDPNGISGPPVESWPTFMFIDKNMVIKSTLRGYSEAYIHELIQNSILE